MAGCDREVLLSKLESLLAEKAKAARAASKSNLSRAEAAGGAALIAGRQSSAQVRDIGLPPECVDPEFRANVENDLELFLQWLSPDVFKWPFSDDQKLSIREMDSVIDRGGLQAIADPRGTGKTQRAIRAALKAIVTGKRKFVTIISATEKKARQIVRALKTILCYNKDFQAIFPAELHGFAQLGGNNRRAAGQLCNGVETAIQLTADQIIFPTIPGSKSSGAIISSCGITGDIRGQFHTLQDGSVIRPDLVIMDDPQTKESATSLEQTQDRLEIIEGDVLGLAGPETSISCLVLCTVIAANDLSERLLKDPKWHGRRTKTINVFPTNVKLWDEYFEEYEEAIRCNEPERINARYLALRQELDAGCELAWSYRKEANDISSIQTAMHIWHRVGPYAFSFEYQNETLVDRSDRHRPKATNIAIKLIHLPRGIVPHWATKMTAFIDVHLDLLYWMTCAWSDEFTGHLVDYGSFPEQPRTYYTLADANPTLRQESGSSQPQGAIRYGLDRLSKKLLGSGWRRENGGMMHVSRCGVDEGFNMQVIHEFVKRSEFGGILIPCKGLGIKAGSKPVSEWKAEKNLEQLGDHLSKKLNVKTHVRFGKIDTYWWKTFICERIEANPGEKGSFSVFGSKPEIHKLLVDHCSVEKPKETYRGDGTLVWEWSEPVAGQDNHFWDCLSNNAALASMSGCNLENTIDFSANSGPQRRNVVVPDHLLKKRRPA